MKLVLGPDLYNMAAWNAALVEEVNLMDFEEMLLVEIDCLAWDMSLNLYDYDIVG